MVDPLELEPELFVVLDVEDVEDDEVEVEVALVAAVVADRIAIDPPRPRNVATLSAAANMRDRAAA